MITSFKFLICNYAISFCLIWIENLQKLWKILKTSKMHDEILMKHNPYHSRIAIKSTLCESFMTFCIFSLIAATRQISFDMKIWFEAIILMHFVIWIFHSLFVASKKYSNFHNVAKMVFCIIPVFKNYFYFQIYFPPFSKVFYYIHSKP